MDQKSFFQSAPFFWRPPLRWLPPLNSSQPSSVSQLSQLLASPLSFRGPILQISNGHLIAEHNKYSIDLLSILLHACRRFTAEYGRMFFPEHPVCKVDRKSAQTARTGREGLQALEVSRTHSQDNAEPAVQLNMKGKAIIGGFLKKLGGYKQLPGVSRGPTIAGREAGDLYDPRHVARPRRVMQVIVHGRCGATANRSRHQKHAAPYFPSL